MIVNFLVICRGVIRVSVYVGCVGVRLSIWRVIIIMDVKLYIDKFSFCVAGFSCDFETYFFILLCA